MSGLFSLETAFRNHEKTICSQCFRGLETDIQGDIHALMTATYVRKKLGKWQSNPSFDIQLTDEALVISINSPSDKGKEKAEDASILLERLKTKDHPSYKRTTSILEKTNAAFNKCKPHLQAQFDSSPLGSATRFDELQDILSAQQEQLKELGKQKNCLENQFNTANSNIIQLEKDVQLVTEQKQETSEALAILTQEISVKNGAIDLLQQKQEASKTQIEGLLNKASTLKIQMKTLKEAQSDLEKTKEELSEKNKALNENQTLLTDAEQRASKALEDNQHFLSDRAAMTLLEKELTEVKAAKKQLKGKIAPLEQQMARLKGENDKLLDELEAKTEENSVLLKEIEKLGILNAKQREALESGENTQALQDRQIKELILENAKYEQETKELETTHFYVIKQNTQLENKNHELAETLHATKQKLAEKAPLEQKIDSLQQKMNELEKDCALAVNEEQKSQAKKLELEKSIEDLKKLYETFNDKHVKKIQKLEEQLDAQKEQEQVLLSQKQLQKALEGKIETLEARLVVAVEELAKAEVTITPHSREETFSTQTPSAPKTSFARLKPSGRRPQTINESRRKEISAHFKNREEQGPKAGWGVGLKKEEILPELVKYSAAEYDRVKDLLEGRIQPSHAQAQKEQPSTHRTTTPVIPEQTTRPFISERYEMLYKNFETKDAIKSIRKSKKNPPLQVF